MIVRELFAVLGIDMDDASFERADSGLEKLKGAATALGTIFVSGLVAQGLSKFVRMASDVEETTNVLGVAFEDQMGTVVDWSRTTAAAVGRSEFQLQRFASQIGAMTRPILGSSSATAQLSTDISQLAIDLGSFFNTTDEEALVALKAGLVGETEPLRRFGIVLTEASLQQFALSRGIQKTVGAMTEAEKLQLRYAFIMERTAQAQGDAERTAEGFANASKALQSRLSDLATRIGLVLLPFATKLVTTARDALNRFLELAEGTRIIETALIALGAIAAVVGVKMLLPFLPAIAAAAGVALALGAIIVVAEDVWAFFTGRGSVLGDVIDRLKNRFEGLGPVLDLIGQIATRVWDGISEVATRTWEVVSATAMAAWEALAPVAADAVAKIGEAFETFLAWVEPRLQSLLEFDFEAAVSDVGEFFDGFGRKISEFISSPLGKTLLTLLGAYLGKKAGEALGGTVGGALGELAGSVGRRANIPFADEIGRFVGQFAGDNLGGLAGTVIGGLGSLKLASGEFNSKHEIEVKGPVTEETKQEIKRAAEVGINEAMGRIQRDTGAGLLPFFGPAS